MRRSLKVLAVLLLVLTGWPVLSASAEPRHEIASLCVDDLTAVQDLAAVEAEVDELRCEIQVGREAERTRQRAEWLARS